MTRPLPVPRSRVAGFTLVEVVLAIAIVAGTMMVMISIMSAQSNAIQDLRKSEREVQQRDRTSELLQNLNPMANPHPKK